MSDDPIYDHAIFIYLYLQRVTTVQPKSKNIETVMNNP
jgi:hypothetical protein